MDSLKHNPRVRFALIVWLFPFIAGVCGLAALGYYLFPPDATLQIRAYGAPPRPLWYDLFAFLGRTVPFWFGISSISFFIAYGLYKPTSTDAHGQQGKRSPRMFFPALVITILSILAMLYPLMIGTDGVNGMLAGAFYVLFLAILLPANITAWAITIVQFFRAKPPTVNENLFRAMDTPSDT